MFETREIISNGEVLQILRSGIGLGYVEAAHKAVDTEIAIEIRNKAVKAKVVKLPFYKK